jgi:hypothetical protein
VVQDFCWYCSWGSDIVISATTLSHPFRRLVDRLVPSSPSKVCLAQDRSSSRCNSVRTWGYNQNKILDNVLYRRFLRNITPTRRGLSTSSNCRNIPTFRLFVQPSEISVVWFLPPRRATSLLSPSRMIQPTTNHVQLLRYAPWSRGQ